MSTARRFRRGASAVAVALAMTAAAVPAADAATPANGVRTHAAHTDGKAHKQKAHRPPKRALPRTGKHTRDMTVCSGGDYWEHWSFVYAWYSYYGWQEHVTHTTAAGATAIVDQWRVDYYWYWRDTAGQWRYGGYLGSGC